MTDQQIMQAIQDAIKKNASSNQFGVSKIPAHNHDGVGSMPVDASFLTFTKGYLTLPNLSADPIDKIAGSVAYVSGKLKVCDGTNWIIVGTQT